MKTFRFVSIVMIVAVLSGLASSGGKTLSASTAARPEPIAIGAMPVAGTHLVPPSRSALDQILVQEGLPLNATETQRMQAEQVWFKNFEKQSDTWVNPAFQEYVNEREKQLGGLPNNLNLPDNLNTTGPIPVKASVFAVAVDFGGTDTITIPVDNGSGCVTTTTTITGPRVGEIAAPEADDNFTLWYTPEQVKDAKFYEKIIFGYEGAGRVRMDLTDPDDGQPGINLTGYTVQDYYDHVAGKGNVTIEGSVQGWVTVDHSEGYYGADNCASGNHGGGNGVPVAQLVIDAVNKFNAAHPSYWTDPDFWPQYDGNHDGILDTFWIIHAGMGQESGGGAEGSFSIWSHSSDLRNYYPTQYPNGYKIYEGDAATSADDIYVGPYTMQPEMAETGVFAEEFGHNFFGLPDLYTNDANNSIGDWAIMSGGAWTGWLGGTVPASMPLWFKMIAAGEVDGQYVPLNWNQPMVTRAYNAPKADVEIGQLEGTPDGVNKGVRVSLPPIVEEIPNEAGEGGGAYSGTGRNDLDITLAKDISVPASGAGVLSFDAAWDIEEDWDYGYVMVNNQIVDDMGAFFRNTNPNSNNLGWGLTGTGKANLKFDLSAFKGQTVKVALRYRTDAAATEAGWWVDNVQLDGVVLDDFSTAANDAFPGWTNSDPGWYSVPTSASFTNYYLVEWRSKTKYDRMVKTAYIFNDDDTVSYVPYNIPAALVYYRNTKYGSTYAQRGYYGDAPSYGSKYQLLIVDQNWKPLRLFNGNTYVAYLTGRSSAYDAGLTLQPSQAFSIPSISSLPGVGPYSIASKPAVTQFNDGLGYYGGYYYGTPCTAGGICYAERDGSAVIPARGPYSTRITNFNFQPIYGLYKYPWAPSWLGSGNPADDNMQYGVNIQLLNKTGDDAENSLATLRFYNYSVDILSSVTGMQVRPDGISATYQITLQNVGIEEARNIVLDWITDSGQHVTAYRYSGTQNAVARESSKSKDAALPSYDELYLTFPSLAAGKEINLTIETFAPMSLVSGDSWSLYPELYASDGQINRGPYWNDLSGDAYFVRLPMIGGPVQP